MVTVAQFLQDLNQSTPANKLKISLDTNCVRYFLENRSPWFDCLSPIFDAALDGRAELYLSIVAVSELLARAHFDNRYRVGYDPEISLLATLQRHFQPFLEVDETVAKRAGSVRGNYVPNSRMQSLCLSTPDALIGATSLINSHDFFITNDEQLARALAGTNTLFLNELVAEWLKQAFQKTCLKLPHLIPSSRTTSGLLKSLSLPSELRAIRPDATATLDCIISDAHVASIAINEPCIFFILLEHRKAGTLLQEVLLWHQDMNDAARSIIKITKYLREHISYRMNRQNGDVRFDSTKSIYILLFTSVDREQQRQNQPNLASRDNWQKQIDSLKGYLKPLWDLRDILNLPRTTWLFCENSKSYQIDPDVTEKLLEVAKSVLGWKEER